MPPASSSRSRPTSRARGWNGPGAVPSTSSVATSGSWRRATIPIGPRPFSPLIARCSGCCMRIRSPMTVEERIAALERRLRAVEDELDIRRLLASYGPLVDAGDGDAVGGLWAEDGEYDVDGWVMRGRADVAAMVRSPAHQGMIGGGAAHFLGPVCVHVD